MLWNMWLWLPPQTSSFICVLNSSERVYAMLGYYNREPNSFINPYWTWFITFVILQIKRRDKIKYLCNKFLYKITKTGHDNRYGRWHLSHLRTLFITKNLLFHISQTLNRIINYLVTLQRCYQWKYDPFIITIFARLVGPVSLQIGSNYISQSLNTFALGSIWLSGDKVPCSKNRYTPTFRYSNQTISNSHRRT